MPGRGPMKGQGGRPLLTGDRLLASSTYQKTPSLMANRLAPEQNENILRLGLPSPEIVADPLAFARWRHTVTHCIWLRETDRAVVEMLCQMLAYQDDCWRNGRQPDEKTINAAVRLAAALGMTPTTRGRVLMTDQQAKGEKAKKGSKYSEWKP